MRRGRVRSRGRGRRGRDEGRELAWKVEGGPRWSVLSQMTGDL